MDDGKIKRHIGIELLRVVSMLMIITLHWGGFGIKIIELIPYSFEWFFAWTVRGFAYMSVNTYVLISAYFLYHRCGGHKKLFQLWLEVVVYSLGIYLITIVTGNTQLSFKGLLHYTTPILSMAYWFVTSYVGMFFLSPFLNKSLQSLELKEHRNLCILLCVLFSIVPNFFFWSTWLNWGSSCGIVWFVVLYVIGAYIRRLSDTNELNIPKVKLWRVAALSWLLPVFSKIIIALLSQILTGDIVGSSVFYMNNSVIVLAGSIFTFLAFRSMDITNVRIYKVILFLSQGSFAVYLIHEHGCLRDIIWNFVGEHTHRDSWLIVVDYFATVVCIYSFCVVVDYLRSKLFKLVNVDSLCNRLSKNCDSLYNRFLA